MRSIFFVVAALILLAACTDQDKPASPNTSTSRTVVEKTSRSNNPEQLARGQLLFLKHCAECHGQNAEGAPYWSRPDSDGKYPAPPLNGTGHAWHHPMRALIYTIKNGTGAQGGNMPAWRDKLSDQDIVDIIAWFQSLWPDELYDAWDRVNRESIKQ